MTDSGVEFRSNDYHATLATLEIEKQLRPRAAARWGQEVERAFGSFIATFLAAAPGRVESINKRRATTRAFRPEENAAIEPLELHKHFDRFAAEYFNAHARGGLTKAPSILMREGIEHFPFAGVPFELDDTFRVNTSVTATRSEYKVDPTRGIYVNDCHYALPGDVAATHRAVSDVRVDPEDDSVIYVHANRRWHACYSGRLRTRIGNSYLTSLYETMKLREGLDALSDAEVRETACIGTLQRDVQKISAKRKPPSAGKRPRHDDVDAIAYEPRISRLALELEG